MARNPDPPPAPGDDDRILWRTVTRDIEPLKGRAAAPPHRSMPPAARPPTPTAPPPRSVPPPAPRAAPPPLDHGRAPGLDKRTRERLKRGQLPIEARLDLHGLTRDEAHRGLIDFILGAHEAGRRTVLVITGKGLRPEGGAGILRGEVPRWINQPPLRERVLAFCHAQPKHGGQGALYVLLKRKR